MVQLTILMPAYNASLYISEAVESLLNQTFRDFELWIIDDGSTDSTAEKVLAFTDSRIHFFKNENNIGRVATANNYVRKVVSPYFTITDADDVSHPLRLEKQIQLLSTDSNLLMCGTAYVTMTESGFCFRTTPLPSNELILQKNLAKHAQFHGPTTIMKKEVLQLVQPFYRTSYFESDADLCCRILSCGRARNVEEALYYYRVVPGSMSREKMDAVFLNSYRIVFWLHQQRAEMGKDVLERGNFVEMERFVERIKENYSVVSLFHQRAFRDFYWGLSHQAIGWSWKAIGLDYTNFKSYAVFTFICFRTVFSLVKMLLTSKHYSVFIKGS